MPVPETRDSATLSETSATDRADRTANPDLPLIAVHDNRLVIGGEIVPDAHFSHNRVSWTHESARGGSSGVMYFDPNGKALYTVVDTYSDETAGSQATDLNGQLAPTGQLSAAIIDNATPRPDGLRLSGLFALLPDEKVTEDTQALMQESMRWALAQTERTEAWLSMMGSNKPALDAEHEKIVRQSLWWYTEVYATAVLTHALQGSPRDKPPSVRLSDKQALAVKQFVGPGLDLHMSSSKHYALQNKALYMMAYRRRNKELFSYIYDRSTDWAAELQSWLETEQFATLVKNAAERTGHPDAMTILNHWTTLLEALDPSGHRAKDFHQKVLTAYEAQVHVDVSKHVDQFDPETVEKWLPDVLRSLLIKIADGSAKFDGISPKQAQDLMDSWIERGASVARAFGEVLLIADAAHFDMQETRWAEAFRGRFVRTNPRLAFLGGLVVPAAGILSVLSVVLLLKEKTWEGLSDRERANVVLQLVQNVINLKSVWQAALTVKELTQEAWWDFRLLINPDNFEIQQLLYPRLRERKMFGYQAVLEDNWTVASHLRSPKAPPPKGWARLMKGGVGEAMLKVAATAAAWVAVGFSAWKLHEDRMKGESDVVIGLDAASLAFGLLGATFLTVDLLIATSVLPWLAVACVVFGVVFEIAEAFVPHKTPADRFIEDWGLPFSKGLLENGSTHWIFDDSSNSGENVNSVDVGGAEKLSIEIRYDEKYGIVNLRFWHLVSSGKREPIRPKINYSHNGEDGWLTPDHNGETNSTANPVSPGGMINGIRFAKHRDRGLVNLCITRDNTLDWDRWETSGEMLGWAEKVSQPRVCQKISKVWVRREPRYGIVDAHFDYSNRIV